MKTILLAIIFTLSITSTTYSQLKEGNSLLGPSIGLWTSWSVPTYGVNYEYNAKQIGKNASISVGGVFRYTGYSDKWTYGSYTEDIKYTYIVFGLQSNIHLNNGGKSKFVPFLGAVLGYNVVSVSYSNNVGSNFSASANSGLWLWGQVGIRYFLAPNVSATARIGAGNYRFVVGEIGLDFKF